MASSATASSSAWSAPTTPRPNVGMDDGTGLAQAAGPCAVDALLASSRALTAITTRLLEPAAGETTSAQYRVLAVLALHDPMRMTDLSAALEILPSSAARLCDRLAHEGLIQRQRAPGNRRVVLVSVTAAGRQAASQVTAPPRPDRRGPGQAASRHATGRGRSVLHVRPGRTRAIREPGRAPLPPPAPDDSAEQTPGGCMAAGTRAHPQAR